MGEVALDFSDDDIQTLLNNLDAFSADEIAEIEKITGELSSRKENQAAYNDLIAFCKLMMPDFIVGKHHRILANMLMDIESGDKDRVASIYRPVTANLSLFLSSIQRGFWVEIPIKRS